MRRLRWLIPLVSVGALLALVVVARLYESPSRPSAATGRASLTASASVVSAPSSTAPPAPASPAAIASSTPYGAATCSPSSTAQTAQVSPPAFPFSVWENDPSGVNLRAAANITSAKIGALSQGTQASADQRTVDDGGSPWYHLTVGSQTGWARADFFITTPSHVTSMSGWKLMAPDQYHLIRWSDGIASYRNGGSVGTLQTDINASQAFLLVQTNTADAQLLSPKTMAISALRMRTFNSPTVDLPAWREIATKPIQVWSFTSTEHTASVSGCDGPWVSYFNVESQASAAPCEGGCIYQFMFVSTQADDPLITQVIASIALDQKIQVLG